MNQERSSTIILSVCINKPVVGMVDRLNDPEAELELRERLPFRAMHTST